MQHLILTNSGTRYQIFDEAYLDAHPWLWSQVLHSAESIPPQPEPHHASRWDTAEKQWHFPWQGGQYRW